MASPDPRADLAVLESIERGVLWLAALAVHHANTRPNPDGTKVGGHQASSSSVVSLMTALYFGALRAGGGGAAQHPAAAPRRRRAPGGLQAYPSRRKNPSIIDLSTGSMGLGAVTATFAALAGRYVGDHWGAREPSRFITMMGDDELDEGNVWESILEEHVAGLGNLLWIVDMNRQSLDRVTPDGRRRTTAEWFGAAGWRVIELRSGPRLQALFAKRGGGRLRPPPPTTSNPQDPTLLSP